MMKWLSSACALLLGLAIGYWVAHDGEDAATKSSETARSVFSKDNPEASEEKEKKQEALTDTENAAVSRSEISKEWLESLESKDQLDQLAALIPKIQAASPGDFASLMSAIEKYGGNMERMCRDLLSTRWAETDPEGMLGYIQGQPENKKWSLYRSFYTVWARDNTEAAFASAKDIEDRRIRSSAIQSVINATVEKEPHRAVEMAQAMQQEAGRNYSWIMQNVFRTWARSEPEAARMAALELPEGEAKVRALSGAMSEWVADDPAAALHWLDSLPTDGSVYNSRKEVFRDFLNRDFDTAKQFIQQRTDPIERREVLSSMYFGNFAYRMDFEEIKGVYDWLGEVSSGQTYDQKVSDVVHAMVDIDTQQAIDFTMNLGPGNARMNALGRLGSALAEKDPAMAIAFAEGMAYEDEKQRVLQNMGWQLSRHGAEQAAEAIAASSDPMVQEQLSRRITEEWSQYDREGALAWAESLTSESARNNAMRPVFNNWLQSDPEGALNYLQTSVEDKSHRNYLSNAFAEWTREDPETAVAWLEQLPDTPDDQRSYIYGRVANYYVQHDPMAASEWISTLDKGPARDQSVESLVSSIVRTDPEAGFIWAATVDDAGRRENSLKSSISEWVKTDPNAAYQAVKDATIDAEEKEPLMEMIERELD